MSDDLSSSSGSYSRDQRIVKTDEFSSVFRLRPVYRTAHFVLYARANECSRARLGVVAAKRLASRAVTRNTVKRIARELFRQSTLPAFDCIVRLSRPVNTKAGPARTTSLKVLLHAELAQVFAHLRSPAAAASVAAVAAAAAAATSAAENAANAAAAVLPTPIGN